MKHISILVPIGDASLTCIEGAYTLFNKSNEFLKNADKPRLFNVHLIGLNSEVQLYDSLFTVYPDMVIDEKHKTDLIIIPPVNGEIEKVIAANRGFLPWMVKKYREGSEVASLGAGAFLLGATGLLKGKKCATHWLIENDFRKMFPDINIVSDKIITDEYGIYSSAGGNSFWNLLLYLLEKYSGRELAIQCAKYFEIEIDRTNQSPFMIFIGPRDHQDEPVKKAQSFIENNFQSKITVDQLSLMSGIGRRTLERRFKKATYNTVSEYIHKIKIEAAKKSIERGRKGIDEIMKDVGYTDTKAFRAIFKKTTGLSPIEYRNKFNKEAGIG